MPQCSLRKTILCRHDSSRLTCSVGSGRRFLRLASGLCAWPVTFNNGRVQCAIHDTKSLLYFGGSLAAPSTAFMYDGLAIMPLGQQLWLKELESYKTYPPMQSAETYNLGQVLNEVKKTNMHAPSD